MRQGEARSEGMLRREFLARIGMLGLTLPVLPGMASGLLGGLLEPSAAVVRAALEELARDTINGFVVFVVPGPDQYSVAQGVSTSSPGALEARTTDFLMQSLDNFVPLPDMLLTPVVQSLVTAAGEESLPLPPGLSSIGLETVRQLDDALLSLLANDQTVPASVPVALLLNFLATTTDPVSLQGIFLSPFARLSYADKAAAYSMLEGPDANLVATLEGNLPEPLKGSVSGLLKFLAGALLEFAGLGTYCEYSAFDPSTRTLTGVPVGWALTGFEPNGPVEGWDEFKGYYEGRTQVTGP